MIPAARHARGTREERAATLSGAQDAGGQGGERGPGTTSGNHGAQGWQGDWEEAQEQEADGEDRGGGTEMSAVSKGGQRVSAQTWACAGVLCLCTHVCYAGEQERVNFSPWLHDCHHH